MPTVCRMQQAQGNLHALLKDVLRGERVYPRQYRRVLLGHHGTIVQRRPRNTQKLASPPLLALLRPQHRKCQFGRGCMSVASTFLCALVIWLGMISGASAQAACKFPATKFDSEYDAVNSGAKRLYVRCSFETKVLDVKTYTTKPETSAGLCQVSVVAFGLDPDCGPAWSYSLKLGGLTAILDMIGDDQCQEGRWLRIKGGQSLPLAPYGLLKDVEARSGEHCWSNRRVKLCLSNWHSCP